MRLEWLPVAGRDRERQLAYVAERDVRAAIDLGDAIEMAVSRLSAHPRIGRIGRIRGTRELVIAGTPYILAYRIEEHAIVILRLLHGAQNWPRSF